MIFVKNGSISEIGSKAYNLINLNIKNTPKLYVVPTYFFDNIDIFSLEKEIPSVP